MNPILCYGVPSGCSFGSIVALEWLGKPYQLCRVEMPEMVTTEVFRRINPVAETPSLLTNTGDVISESIAILSHIGAQGIEQKLGFAQGTREFDQLNQMLAFLNTTFFGAFAPLWHALEHSAEGAKKEALTHYGRGAVERAHTALEAMLGNKEWLLGKQRTLADAYFIGIARWNEYHKVVDRRDYPGLQRLYNKLEADQAVIFAHAIERQEVGASSGGFQGEIGLSDVLARLK
ncbi:glutathione S-transferase family protein [Microbulbifer harenosus]|uniref:Glutathione S-transferase family protein n=1 Tax=Microbulbifer harenosus TaxID=2576840 RepID=A0ABY2UGD3_9GAMM|nr:glutathione S-transferase family protein [Microbulbifer harenosus]TLM76593.1 glutathione S-transferase family protein [Microbulbifer harenosus]